MKLTNTYKLRITTFLVAIIISISIIYIHFLSHDMTQRIYIKQTEKTIIDMKKDFLKDTVNNVCVEIDKLRQSKRVSYKRNVKYRLSRIEEELDKTDDEFISFFINKFEDDSNPSMWTALLCNDNTGEILYASSGLDTKNIDALRRNLKTSLSSYAEIEKKDIKAIFGVSKAYIDGVVKKEIGDAIKNRAFSNESYIWVNEVINYEGGKDYAIRKVHPSINEKEVTFLSTDMKDIKGNSPYLEELEGIKKDGEIFFTYYFKKLNSTEVSEKITYAKLYKDYDWIIAMGVHLDEIDVYIEKINDKVIYSSSEYTMKILRYIFVVLLLGFTLLFLLERRNLLNTTRPLENEIRLDALTNAYSRKFGEENLQDYFEKYKKTGESPAIMMFDIDDFKQVNDNFGHEIGDVVLIEIVRAIKRFTRNTDKIIRWGGDEFIGIFPGLEENSLKMLGTKLLEEVSSLDIPIKDATIKTSISIGFSYFKDTDKNYIDVLKRVDKLMYEAKKEGKNMFNF